MRSPQPSARSSPTNSCDGRRRGSWGWRGRLHRSDPCGTARCARGVHRTRAGAASRLSPLTATVPSAHRWVTEANESSQLLTSPPLRAPRPQMSITSREMASPWSENDVMRDMTCLSLNRLNSVRYKSSGRPDAPHRQGVSGHVPAPVRRVGRGGLLRVHHGFPLGAAGPGSGLGFGWFLGWSVGDDGRAPPCSAGPGRGGRLVVAVAGGLSDYRVAGPGPGDCRSGRGAGGGAGRFERGAGAARGGGHRQDGAAGVGGRAGRGYAAGPGGGGAGGDGDGVRRAAPAAGAVYGRAG